MKIRFLISIFCLLLLAPLFKVSGEEIDPSDLQMLKDYFNSVDWELLDDRGRRLKDFVVRPDNPSVSEITNYKLEFSVPKRAYQKLLEGYLVFYFPIGFDLSNLTSAGIFPNAATAAFLPVVHVEGQFAIITYNIAWIDTVSIPLPDRIKLNVNLSQIKNHSQAGDYRIGGAAIKDHKFVAGPSWSERFEIHEGFPNSSFRISSTEIVSPNAPYVNTEQQFQVRSLVHNRQSFEVKNLPVEMFTDGSSSFQSVIPISSIDAHDSEYVYFNVTAADSPNESEKFTTSIAVIGGDVDFEDNEAAAVIQSPAVLEVSSNIEDNSTVHMGSSETLDVSFNLLNHGQAGVSSGHYTLTITGTEINPDTMSNQGDIAVGTPVEFTYESTESGRTVVVNFEVTGTIDSNTLEPAPFIDSEIDFYIVEGAVKPSEPKDSIIAEDNPFNPEDGPVDIEYILPRNMHIDFMIFTIIGEEVLSRRYRAGDVGGSAGVNRVQWDGKNEKGLIVLNGVYVIVVSNPYSDFKLSFKLAVLK